MPRSPSPRLAGAHDWVSNSALNAAFHGLPGASFVVNGAPIPADSALASVGAELHVTTRWSLLARFDGEFARNSQTYAGTGTLRYMWCETCPIDWENEAAPTLTSGKCANVSCCPLADLSRRGTKVGF